MMLGTILLIILICFLVGALPTWPYSTGWGYYPSRPGSYRHYPPHPRSFGAGYRAGTKGRRQALSSISLFDFTLSPSATNCIRAQPGPSRTHIAAADAQKALCVCL